MCSVDVEAQCSASSCVSPLRCQGAQCRTQCLEDSDCLAGTCVETTCVEPASGDDAGVTLHDGGSDAGPDAAPASDAALDAASQDAGLDALVDDAGPDAADVGVDASSSDDGGADAP